MLKVLYKLNYKNSGPKRGKGGGAIREGGLIERGAYFKSHIFDRR